MTDEERDYVRRLFGDDGAPDAQTEPADPVKSNHVPREGTTPTTQPTGDREYREWVSDLFTHSGVPGW